MKSVFKKFISSLIIVALIAGQALIVSSIDDTARVPEQVTISATYEPSKVLNFTWTVKDTNLKDGNVLQVMEKTGDAKFNPLKALKFQAAARKGYNMPGKLVIKATAANLTPDTEYLYRVGNETANIWTEGSFKTTIDSLKDSDISFVYIADPQVYGDDSKAASATFEAVYNKYPEAAFTYVAGDFTDANDDETEWENFFNGGGLYPNGGQKLFANKITVGTQGNHDWAGLADHFSFPSTYGLDTVYSFDAGPVHFIVLNTNYTYQNPNEFQKEISWLENDLKDCKKPWKIVLAHKPIYSGSYHVYDSDTKFLRQYLVPELTRLGVDAVLGGHDHVYTRGFVDYKGNNVRPLMMDGETAFQPRKLYEDGRVYKPVLFMGNCTSGALKWYTPSDYTVAPDDPLAENYAFLEKSSAGFTDKNRYQAYTEVKASNNKLSFTTNMFQYDLLTDKITTEPFVYDKYSIAKSDSSTPLPDTCKISGYVDVEFGYKEEAEGEIRSGFDIELVEKKLYAKTDANGYFEIKNIPVDGKINTITVSKPGYLTRTIDNVIINGNMELYSEINPIAMMAGDIDQNNVINMADIMKIAAAFNSTKGSSFYRIDADYNADGSINLEDIMIAARRFNRVSMDYK